MKKTILSVIIVLGFHYTFGQAYIVTYLKGNVYHDHQLVKLHDRLDGANKLTSDDRNSELALFSAQKGKLRLSFKDSKPVQTGEGTKNSELYQLIVGNYLLTYTTEKTLTSRGDFDLKAFFHTSSAANGDHIFLIEGESLPVKSEQVTLHADDNFFLCTINGKDTTSAPLKRNTGYLIFDDSLGQIIFSGSKSQPRTVVCFVKRGFTLNGKYAEEVFSGSVSITFLLKDYVQTLVSSFSEGMATYYKDDKGKLTNDIEDQLSYYYGRNFEPAVRQVLKHYE